MAGSLCARTMKGTFLLLTVGFVALPPTLALADIFEWTDPNDGVFNDPNNWTVTAGGGSPPPATNDTANFNDSGTYTVTFAQNEVSEFMNVTAGDVTFLSDSATQRTYSVTSGLGRADVSGGTLEIGSETNPVFLDVLDSFNIGFTGNGTVSVSGASSRLDAQGPSHSLGFSNTQGTLNVSDGATANFGTAGAGGTLNVGDSPFGGSDGIVNVNTVGTLNTGHIDIAPNNSGATGTVTVSDSGSSINQTLAGANLTIGNTSGGAGTLNIENDGSFTTGTGTTTINATGTINIDDGVFNADAGITIDGGTINVTNTDPINTDLIDTTSLTIQNGGLFDSDTRYETPDNTTINVTGSGSELRVQGASDIFLIVEGAQVTVSNSGALRPDRISIREGTVTIDGVGAELDATSASTGLNNLVGNGGVGTLRLINGATGSLVGATDEFLFVGRAQGNTTPGTGLLEVTGGSQLEIQLLDINRINFDSFDPTMTGTGTVTVDGAGSSITQVGEVTLRVGEDDLGGFFPAGAGTLNITNGGTFSATTTVSPFATTHVDDSGTINVDGGTFNATNSIFISGGTINLISGAINADRISLIAGAINFSGGTLHVNQFTGDLLNQGGTLAPGGSAGITTVTGSYTVNAGNLEIELFDNGGGTPVPGVDFDQLVADTANLAGTLELVIDPNYSPTVGDMFEIVSTTSGVSGTFGNVLGAYLGGGLGFEVQYNVNDVTIEAINVLLGDFDVDGDVDGIDFLFWQLDPSVGPLSDWETNYGMVGPLSAASAAVPEPGCLLLVATAIVALSLRRTDQGVPARACPKNV